MNKGDLITAVSENAKLSKKDAEASVKATIDFIEDSLNKGEKVTLVGFGTFEVTNRAERVGRNPRDPKESIIIPARKLPIFSAGKEFRDLIES